MRTDKFFGSSLAFETPKGMMAMGMLVPPSTIKTVHYPHIKLKKSFILKARPHNYENICMV